MRAVALIFVLSLAVPLNFSGNTTRKAARVPVRAQAFRIHLHPVAAARAAILLVTAEEVQAAIPLVAEDRVIIPRGRAAALHTRPRGMGHQVIRPVRVVGRAMRLTDCLVRETQRMPRVSIAWTPQRIRVIQSALPRSPKKTLVFSVRKTGG